MNIAIRQPLSGSPRLAPLFNPRSVAVLGASRTPTKFGHVLLKELLDHGYPGAIYPINPAADEILGLRCLPDIGSIPGGCDLALIALPVSQVLRAFEDCVAAHAKAAIIITSGFAEIGEEGRRIEEALTAASRRSGVPFVGPNCQGVVDTGTPLYAVMAGAMYQDPVPSRTGISIISHSGGYTGYCFRECANQGIGIAKAISSGNEAVLGLVDFLEVLGDDEATKAILLHLEGVTEADGFRAIAARIAGEKPIVINHVGRTPAAATAATTHTAHLAAPGRVLAAFYRQCGAVVTGDQEAAIDAATILAAMPAPAGRGVAVISFSGGMRVEFADLLAEAGFDIPAFAPTTEEVLSRFIPSHGSVKNPIDMADGLLVDPTCPAQSIAAVAGDPAVDIIVVILTITRDPAVAEGIVAAARATGKPVVVMCTAQAYSQAAMAILRAAAIPVYQSTRRAMNAVSALDQRRLALRRVAATPAPPLAVRAGAISAGGAASMPSVDAFALLEAAGLECVPWRSFDPDVAIQSADLEGLILPAAVKFDSAALPHKTEAGAVVLGCLTVEDVEAARRTVVAAARAAVPGIAGAVLVQQMAQGIGEVMVGFQRDAVVGPLVMLGTGGIMVELFDDVAIRVLPATLADFAEMLDSLRGAGALKGFRGRPVGDIAALLALVERAAALFAQRPDIVSMDMNPIIVGEHGAAIVDVLIQTAVPDAQGAEGAH